MGVYLLSLKGTLVTVTLGQMGLHRGLMKNSKNHIAALQRFDLLFKQFRQL